MHFKRPIDCAEMGLFIVALKFIHWNSLSTNRICIIN